MRFSSEKIRRWLVDRTITKAIVRCENTLIFKTSFRNFQLNIHGNGATGARFCWDNNRQRFFEVSYETPDFLKALENELEPALPDWPRAPLMRAVCGRLREQYGQRAVTIDSFEDRSRLTSTESLILSRSNRCYELYLQGDHLVIAAESYERDQHVRELELADPSFLHRIEPTLDDLARDPVGIFFDFMLVQPIVFVKSHWCSLAGGAPSARPPVVPTVVARLRQDTGRVG